MNRITQMTQDRELVIVLDEAEQETVMAINCIMQKYGLPCYLLEFIVDKIHRQLIAGKVSELSAAKTRQTKTEEATNESNE